MKVIPYGFPCKGKINFVLLTDINWLNGFQKILHTAKSVKNLLKKWKSSDLKAIENETLGSL